MLAIAAPPSAIFHQIREPPGLRFWLKPRAVHGKVASLPPRGVRDRLPERAAEPCSIFAMEAPSDPLLR